MKLKKRGFEYLVFYSLLLALLSDIVHAAPTDILFRPLNDFNMAVIYSQYGFVIDCLIYFMILMGASEVALRKQFKDRSGRGAKAIVLGVGFALSFSVAVWEATSGWRLANLWPLALAMVFIIFAFAFYNFIKIEGDCARAFSMLSFTFLFYFFQALVPGIANWFARNSSGMVRWVWAIMNLVAMIALIWGLVELVRCLWKGGGGSGGGGSSGGHGGSNAPEGGGGQRTPQQQEQQPRQQQEQQQEPQQENQGPGRVNATITHPEQDIQIPVRTAQPLPIAGTVDGPEERYNQVWALYNEDGSINQGLDSYRNVPRGEERPQQLNVGQLPEGTYALFFFAAPANGTMTPPHALNNVPENQFVGVARRVIQIVPTPPTTIRITHPANDTPTDPDAVTSNHPGGNNTMRIEGVIEGPYQAYDYIWGIYDHNHRLRARMDCPNGAPAQPQHVNVNFSNCQLVDPNTGNNLPQGRIPPGNYRIVLYARPRANNPEAPADISNPDNLPDEIRIANPAVREIQITQPNIVIQVISIV